MSVYNTTGIVLKSSPFREVDRLVTIYTNNFGKLTFLLKGGLKIKSKLAGHLEPLSLTEINWARGRYFDWLTSASVIEPFYKIKNDLDKINFSLSGLEILNQLTLLEKADPLIFRLAADFLNLVEQEKDYLKLRIYWNVFLWQLLKLLGLNPNFSYCLKCSKKIKENENFYFDFRGGLVHKKCTVNQDNKVEISNNEIKIINLFLTKDLSFWKNRIINKNLLDKVEQILKKFLAYHDYIPSKFNNVKKSSPLLEGDPVKCGIAYGVRQIDVKCGHQTA